MKKQLIGSTALVSAGALVAVGTIQEAQAADPLSLTVGGYYQAALQYQDSDDSTGDPGHDKQNFSIYDDGEIQFTASTTLDNGIGVKTRIEFEAKNQGSGGGTNASTRENSTIVDERYVDFTGSFGILRIGSDDNASNAMHYQAPVAAGMMGVNTPTFAVPIPGGNALGSYPTTYVNTGGDAQKIIWFSPRIAGFQLGVSYAPNGSVTENQKAVTSDGPGDQEDIISVGLNFVETFNDIDVAVSGGYLHGERQGRSRNFTTTTTIQTAKGPVFAGTTTRSGGDGAEEWSAGLNVGFAGFTVGASVRLSNGAANNADSTTYDAGVTYATGPLTVGFTYLHAEAESTGGDDETDQFVVNGLYNIGPGVDLWGGVKYYEYDDGANASGSENEGYIVALGSSVSF